jgi:hypothetical protein
MTRGGPNQTGAAELPYTPGGERRFREHGVSKFDYTGHRLPAELFLCRAGGHN